MSIRKVNFAEGEYYHLYNRGNSKQKIFLDKKDYQHFIKLLYLCNSNRNFVFKDITQDTFEFDREGTLVSIGAYCLMPNHFHILVKEKGENGVSKFMQKLSTAYVMYFNVKYKRTGSLFEGKFKSQHANSDRHLKYLFSYIHLNPIKLIQPKWKERGIQSLIKSKSYIAQYPFSSYSDYSGERRIESGLISGTDFPDYFSSVKILEAEIFEWLSFTP